MRAVSAIGTPAGLSIGEAGWQSFIIEVRDAATDHEWINDDPWAMGVLEPFILLLFIAVIGALLGLL